MKYAVKLTDSAKQDLRSIGIYIYKETGNKQLAINFVNELKEKVTILETFPNCGSIPDDRMFKSLGYRFLTYGSYLIFYYVDEDNMIVNILTIFNAKEDYSRVMIKYIR